MSDFTYDVDADGIAIITWDAVDKSMNVLTREAFGLVEEFIDRALADDAVKGVVITSGKKDFADGMDLNVLASIREESGENAAQGLFDFTMNGHRILRKLERAEHGGQDQQGRQADCLRDQWHLCGHRHRDRVGLPLPQHDRQSEGQDRPAGNPAGYLPRRRRHHPLFQDGWCCECSTGAAGRQDAGPQEGEICQPCG